ncbi:MAG: tRNA pseudouridine(55) synthase TruB [Candidatus Pacebacteria bacterium]|nr:tRNA pseudouridine(55) synthase TruB [Candidatus Paceibacterota bacterium]
MDLTKFSTIEEVKKEQKGIILIDKDQDWTSHDVVAKLRRIVGVKKIGHAGTLDPLATGLLIILVGREFTKLQDQFMKQDKEYEVEAEFGITTDSYDAMGEIVTQLGWDAVSKITKDDLNEAMIKLTGEIEQTVPAYSAVKVKGKKLYQKARKGDIDLSSLPSRIVNIYNFELIEFNKDVQNKKVTAKFYTKVSSGTYIRSLIHDLGQLLQVGAYVTQLRRVSIGNARVDRAEQIE